MTRERKTTPARGHVAVPVTRSLKPVRPPPLGNELETLEVHSPIIEEAEDTILDITHHYGDEGDETLQEPLDLRGLFTSRGDEDDTLRHPLPSDQIALLEGRDTTPHRALQPVTPTLRSRTVIPPEAYPSQQGPALSRASTELADQLREGEEEPTDRMRVEDLKVALSSSAFGDTKTFPERPSTALGGFLAAEDTVRDPNAHKALLEASAEETSPGGYFIHDIEVVKRTKVPNQSTTIVPVVASGLKTQLWIGALALAVILAFVLWLALS